LSKNLITGGLGFLGSYLARQLVDKGEEVVIFDLAKGSKLIEDIKDKVKVVRGDLTDGTRVLVAMRNNDIDCIYHLAALVPPNSEQNLAATFELNVQGTIHVLETARLLKVGSVIFVSTLATYGLGVPHLTNEDVPQQPRNMYGITKVCCERLGEQYHLKYGVNFRGVRFPPVLGGGRRDSAHSAFSYLAIKESVRGRPYTIYVEKETRMPTIYIKDAVRSLVSLREANEGRLKRRIYNICGFSFQAGELANEVQKRIPEAQLDFRPDATMLDMISNWPALDDARARDEWGWWPKYGLSEAVEDFIAEIRANPSAYE
jgi:nucleoside-diphosphate-sugar epimerase